MKKIVVTGDLVMDYNILQLPSSPLYHHQAILSTIEYQEKGGAWFLAKLLKRVCDTTIKIIEPPYIPQWEMDEKTSPMNKAYQVWSLFVKTTDGNEKGKVWRIKDFLGCERTQARDSVSLPALKTNDAEILVIDDLGLNFRNNTTLWPSLLTDGHPQKIFIKTSSIDITSPLWQKLLQPELASKVTVILSVATLRERGAAISKGFSWDRTLEELVDEFSSSRSASELGKCRRVIVFFHGDVVASFTRKVLRFKSATPSHKIRFERFLYDPLVTENHWSAKRPGIVFSGGTCRSFDEFNLTASATPITARNRRKKTYSDERWENLRQKKGSDFVSRLRCYLNIKDLNPAEACHEAWKEEKRNHGYEIFR